ncbi:MAG: cyclic nucleotide-binding domain-containing protein [Cyclobacteriaceae bacterium]
MMNPFKKKYSSEELSLFRFLSKIKYFESLEYKELSHFLPSMYLRTYKQDEVVFFSGDPSYALYIVKNGKVSLQLDIKDKFEILTTVRPGETFGDNSLLNNTKRIYTSVVVSEKADLYVIPQANLLDIMNDNANIRAKMMTSFGELYNDYTSELFKKYKSEFGFFDLRMVYDQRR